MSERQTTLFKQLLIWQLDTLDENAVNTNLNLREKLDFADPTDRATQEEINALELKTRDRERKLKRKIEQALLRIDLGTFGYCEETGEEIGLARLTARPTATLCIEAQERHETRERQFNG